MHCVQLVKFNIPEGRPVLAALMQCHVFKACKLVRVHTYIYRNYIHRSPNMNGWLYTAIATKLSYN